MDFIKKVLIYMITIIIMLLGCLVVVAPIFFLVRGVVMDGSILCGILLGLYFISIISVSLVWKDEDKKRF